MMSEPNLAQTPKRVKTRIENLLQDLTPLPMSSEPNLTDATLRSLKSFFDCQGHDPSPSMWDALTDVTSTMQLMANGCCDPKIFLSSLDPGIGKTQTVVHFIRALLVSPEHDHVGVLLCVSRLDEIRTLAMEMQLADTDFAVVTKDASLNALGGSPTDTARVLFTTQQMVESRGRNRAFPDISEFHFRGHARQVRIWDETILPGQTVTVNRDDIAGLLRPVRVMYPKLADGIEKLFVELAAVADGETVTIPDFAVEYNMDLNEALKVTQGSVRDQGSISDLWFLSGKIAAVRRDGARGNTMLHYKETLPIGLAPLVVLDASGRVRTTYRQWEEGRGGLTRLRSAHKRYDALTVHCWNRAGGKSAFRKQGDELVAGIAATINHKPDQEWLVVSHKPDGIGMDLEEQVRALLTVEDGTKVHFLTWGNHHATNKYAGVPNVILAGTLFYPVSHYEALGRLSAGVPPAEGSPDCLSEIRIGEHRHLVLQALCRGAVRRCVGEGCAPCDAYIIASVASGIPAVLPEIFPGCRAVPWQPIPRVLKGQVAEAAKFVRDWFRNRPSGLLPFKTVMAAIGITDSSNFRKNIRKHADLIEALAEQGVVEQRKGYARLAVG